MQSRGILLRGIQWHWCVAQFPLSQAPPRRAVCDTQSWQPLEMVLPLASSTNLYYADSFLVCKKHWGGGHAFPTVLSTEKSVLAYNMCSDFKDG